MEQIFSEIKDLEIELACSPSRQNKDRLSELLSDSFEEIGISGRKWDKETILSSLVDQPIRETLLENFKFVSLSNSTVLVKYESVVEGSRAHRCSIWVNSGSLWQMQYHQGTLCK